MSGRIIQNYEEVNNQFPRNLSKLEKELLYSLLPENKPGYKLYRDKIDELLVTGYGRFGEGNLILGEKGTIPDNISPSMPVFASGVVEFEECTADVNIHEVIENEIEFDITFSIEKIPHILHEINRWNYSEWNPRQKAPKDNADIREIMIGNSEFVLAIAQTHKKIWLHNSSTGVNHLIPVSNLYNYLMLLKNIREAEIVSKPALFFKEHKNYSDKEIISAFLIYNKYFKKFKINYSLFEQREEKPKQKRLFKIFKRG